MLKIWPKRLPVKDFITICLNFIVARCPSKIVKLLATIYYEKKDYCKN